MKNRYPFLVFIILAALLFSRPISAQDHRKLTLENMGDSTLSAGFSTPRVWWLADNTAILYDTRIPDSVRTLEHLDPSSGARTQFLDKNKARESFTSLFPEGKAPRFSPVPNQIATTGKYGCYLIRGDIYLLDIPHATFSRVTDTREDERSVNFSPDGSKLAFVRGHDLYIYDIREKKELRLTSDGNDSLLNGTLSWVYGEEIFGRSDGGYRWSPDSKWIGFLQTDESGVSVQHYVDESPWTPTVTTQRYPKVGEKNPRVRIGMIEIGTDKTTWAKIDAGSYEYIIRIDWLPDSRSLCVRTMNRLQTELDFYLVDNSSGTAKQILKDTDEGWVNISDDLYFLNDRRHLILASERDGYDHLYRFTMDGRLVNKITTGDWSIRSSGGGAFWVQKGVTGIDEKNGWIYFTALEKSPLEKHLYRIGIDGKGMKRLTDAEGTHAITMSPDARYYFDRYSNISTPPSLTLYRSDGSRITTLAEASPAGFKTFDIQYAELLHVPARDGFQLPVSITKPKDFDATKKYPVIVYVYGGPSAPLVADAFQRSSVWDNVLLNNGYICMTIDNRAATAISKKLENLILKRTPGEVELNDLVDGVRWMKQQPYVDSNRIGIWGWSGGGTNTVLAMSRSTEFKAGIAGGTVTDFRFYDTKWGEALMKTEKENSEGYEQNSLLRYAKDLHGKLLFIHGTHDDNVHIQNIWRFIDELIKADKLFELMVYPMRGHGVGDRAGERHLHHLMLDFWKRNL